MNKYWIDIDPKSTRARRNPDLVYSIHHYRLVHSSVWRRRLRSIAGGGGWGWWWGPQPPTIEIAERNAMRFTFVLLPHPLYIYSSSSATSSTVAVWLIIIAINVIASCIGRSISLALPPANAQSISFSLCGGNEWPTEWVDGKIAQKYIYLIVVQCSAVRWSMQWRQLALQPARGEPCYRHPQQCYINILFVFSETLLLLSHVN